VLRLIADFTRECLAIEVDTSLPGARVVQTLERVSAVQSSQARCWMPGLRLRVSACTLASLGSRSPMPTLKESFNESFNGKVRDECLNEHWFSSIAEARIGCVRTAPWAT
jgi:putative transposase